MSLITSFIRRFVTYLAPVCMIVVFSAAINGTPSAFALLNSAVCLEPHQGWTNSTTLRTDAPWSLHFIPGGKYYFMDNGMVPGTKPKIFEQFTDLNGDGMADFVFSFHQQASSPAVRNCVYLNTGAGWQNVYKCVKMDGRYYGDCAG